MNSVPAPGGAERPPSPARRSHWRRPLIAYVVVVLSLAALGYVVYLDHTVRKQFEGNRWAWPSQVYARPLELFAGASLSSAQFLEELQLLGYRRTQGERLSGSYLRRGEEFQVITRPFTFGDGKEESIPVRVRFQGGRLLSLQHLDSGAPLELVRLDPVLIGKIYPAHNEDRVFVRLNEVPPVLIQALLAVEDRKFHDHFGIDPFAVMRALWADVRAGEMVQGGSTLTQQLVKNFFLTSERTLSRKIKEAIMAWLLEIHYDKKEILEAYSNEIYLGQFGKHAIHGFARASWFYFRRPLNDLKLPEIALLVGLVRGPSYYDPRRQPKRALARRNQVLDILQKQGGITKEESKVAQALSLGVQAKASSGGLSFSPAFIDLVRRQLQRDYSEQDLNSAGLQIFTTLDPLIQNRVVNALSERIDKLERQQRLPRDSLEGAAIITSSDNGEVLAVAGGREADFAGFNRALDARRSIGSLVKPAVYLTALANPKQYTLATLLDDSPLSLKNSGGGTWTPSNYDRVFHGNVSLRSSLAHSYNISTVRLGMDVGVGRVLHMMARLGIVERFRPYPSVLLGAVTMDPFQVTQMYQTLASGGFHTPLRTIREVLSVEGKRLRHYDVTVRQAVEPAPVFLLNRAMQDVMRYGTGASIYARIPGEWAVAGKTGTTDDLRDSWFAGFTGDRLGVVWLGRDDNRSTGLSGATGALQAWGDIMLRIGAQPLRLEAPEGIEWTWTDPATGLRTEEGCYGATNIPYMRGSSPVREGPCQSPPIIESEMDIMDASDSPIGGVVEKTWDILKGVFE